MKKPYNCRMHSCRAAAGWLVKWWPWPFDFSQVDKSLCKYRVRLSFYTSPASSTMGKIGIATNFRGNEDVCDLENPNQNLTRIQLSKLWLDFTPFYDHFGCELSLPQHSVRFGPNRFLISQKKFSLHKIEVTDKKVRVKL